MVGTIQACQLRAARALVGMSQRELAELSGIGIATIKRIEIADTQTPRSRTTDILVSTLEEAGVEFTPETRTRGPGVRLRLSTLSD